MDNAMRKFSGGATRDNNVNKLDYEGYNNPLVDKAYAEYLNKHRQTANGVRESDNWQSLFGAKHTDVCMKSLCRHIVDARLAHRGYNSAQPIIDSLNAIIFNAKAYLLKLLLDQEKLDRSKPVGHSGYCLDCEKKIAEAKNGDFVPLCALCSRTRPVKGGY